jgi:hypothetical protein
MSLNQQSIDALKSEADAIAKEANTFFKRVSVSLAEYSKNQPWQTNSTDVPPEAVSQEDRTSFLPTFSDRVRKLAVAVIEASRQSPLVGEVDRSDLRIALREMLAALQFQNYYFWEAHVLSDEDRYLGVEPASQKQEACSLQDARAEFLRALDKIRQVLRLIYPSETPLATAIAQSQPSIIKKYRPNTAFIMMWISKEHPELEDVKNCFKEVFRQFGITAVRSDEIEHEGVITERILDEIASSEFLIADLTGERPSVYYEIGYAHAMGKRPILYRKAHTHLHFDLSVHNCPEYDNLTDLRQKLQARLSILTNREPTDESHD